VHSLRELEAVKMMRQGKGKSKSFFGKISSGPMTDSHGIIVHGLGAAVLTVRTSSAV